MSVNANMPKGVDSSRHVQIDVSVISVLFKVLGYIIYKAKLLVFSSVRKPIIKAFKKFEVIIDSQKEPLRFREKNDNRCVGFIQSMISSIVVIW